MKKNRVKQSLLISLMKMTLYQFILALVFSTVTMANSLNGQVKLDTKVTISITEMNFNSTLSELSKSADVNFSYNSRMIPSDQKISVTATNEELSSVLSRILTPFGISYEVVSNQIVLQKNVTRNDDNANVATVQQQKTISGTVLDANGLPLPGATITVKGTKNSTATDLDGKFSIKIDKKATTLVVSYIGFDTTEIAIGSKTEFKISLKESSQSLNEVVVVGYGTVKKKDLTGAVANVKATDIVLSPVSSPMEALQGRVSGLDIQRGSGKAGSSPSVLIRGNRSLTASQSPLYIIDGIPSSADNLNTNDIETIDVLKDASSTAIYGSSGANGVIIITTKKAKAGKMQIDFNTYYGQNGFSSFPDPLTGEDWLRYKHDRFYLDNGYHAKTLTELGLNTAAIAAIQKGQWVNWVDQTLKAGSQLNHHLSVRGASEKVSGYFSMGYVEENGIYKNDGVSILNGRGGLEMKFNDKFKTGFQLTLNYRNSETTNSRINKAYSVFPLGLPYDENGNVNLFPLEGDPNNVSILANNYPGAFADETKDFDVQFNPYIEYQFTKDLKLRSNLGTHFSNTRHGNFANKNSYNLLSEGRTASEAGYRTDFSYSYIWENILDYKFRIGTDHDFTATAITSWTDSRNEGSYIAGNGLDYDDFKFYNMGAVKNITSRTNSFSQINKMSFAGRFNYNFKGRYLFQFTNRWDGVSPLAEGNKWASFPSASLGWRVNEESFMKGTENWLNNLKLRVGYGISGTANIDPYSSLTRTATKTTNLSLGGGTALPIYTPTEHISNSDLTWENSTNTNVGLDVALFNNVVDIAAEYYWTKTDGILWDRRIPTSSGGYDAKTPYKKTSNIATSENKGFEIAVNTRNINTKDFSWNTTFTFTKAKEKLTGIDLGNQSVSQLISEGLFLGETPAAGGVFYDYKKIGIWQLGQEKEAALYGAKPGDIKLQTVEQFDANGVSDNGVHVYSAKDKMIVGSNVPDYFFGFQNTFKYKNFDLTVFVNGRQGGMMRAQVLGYWNKEAMPATYDYWTQDNPTNDFPRPGGSFNTQFQSSLELVDASYIKIKNITLGYSMPEDLLKKIRLNSMRFYVTANNPFVFAKSHLLEDVDPESGGSDSFPLYKQLVLGINLSL